MKKRKGRKSLRINYKLCFFAFFAVYVIYAFIGQQSALNQYDRELGMLQADISSMEDELSRLSDLGSVYKSDTFIERVARERLGFVRSDETLFVDISGK